MTSKEFQEIIRYLKSKDFQQAHELIDLELAVNPRNTFLLTNEVYTLFQLKRIEQARKKADMHFEILKRDAFFMQCYLKILAWQKETELLNQIIDSWILQEFQGNEKFYKYLMPFIKTKISPKRFEAIMAKATREFPKASLVDTVKQYTDYKQHYKKYTPKECIAEIEQLRGLPRYEKDQDLLVFLAICYQKTKNYQAALKILVECALIKDSLFIREQIGYCYYYLQDYEQASFYLKACLLEDPMNRTLCLLVEKLYLALNQPKQLYELCQEVLVRHPSAKHLYGYMKRITKWPKN